MSIVDFCEGAQLPYHLLLENGEIIVVILGVLDE